MRTYRIFHPDIINPREDLLLSSEASHHLSVVLRAKAGNPIEVFDDSGAAYQGVLALVAKRVSVRIEQTLSTVVESPLYVHLVQAIGKNDKIDWVIQKAVELGVSEISLLLTERTEVRIPPDQWQKKMAHWRGIVINAVEQSGRTKVPLLNSPIALKTFLAKPSPESLKLMLHVHAQARCSDVLPSVFGRVEVIIGPEGGFSESEAALALSLDYRVVTLGPRTMRTETAPLAILSVLQLLQGDF